MRKNFFNKRFFNRLGFMVLGFHCLPLVAQEIWNGVVVDSDNGFVYSMNPEKGIEATDIDSGDLYWHTNEAEKPLFVISKKLIAQSNSRIKGQLDLSSLEVKSGELFEAKSVQIPGHIYPSINQGLNHQFDISQKGLKSETLLWSHKHKKSQGMLSQNPSSVKYTYGEILIKKGSLTTLASKTLSSKPETNIVSIEGKYLKNIKGRQFKSVDGNFILVSDINKTCSWDKYIWQVYDLNGNKKGSINSSLSYRKFAVYQDVLLFVTPPSTQYKSTRAIETPLSLHAYSLKSGKKIWMKNIRDLSFKGQRPQ